MAFGFPAKHSESFSLNAAAEKIRDAMYKAIEDFDWILEEDLGDILRITVRPSAFSYGAYIRVEFAGESESDCDVRIESRCVSMLIFLDWGKNKEHVENFRAAIEEALAEQS